MADDIKEMTAELARDPDSLVFIRLGEALRVRGQIDSASKVAISGLERHPGSVEAHDLYARILVDAGDLERARTVWEAALQIEGRHKGTHKGLGFLYYSRGELDLALDHLELALSADPSDQSVVQALRVVRAAAESVPEVVSDVVPEEGFTAADMFAGLEGGSDGLLLVDERGRVLAGGVRDTAGAPVADAVAAYLAGISQEAERTSRILDLGDWEWLVAEAEGGNVHLTRPTDGTVLLLIRDASVPPGRLALLAAKANDVARTWLEAQQI
jgi:tetratricopeptide (TPR) repeat protein